MLDWNKIDTVMLDMDGTLLDLHYDNYFWLTHFPKRYAEIKGLPLVEAQALIYDQLRALRGQLKWYCLNHWQEVFAIDLLPLKQEVAYKVQFLLGVQDFLNQVKASGRQLLLVTNAHQISISVKRPAAQLERWMDAFYLSHDFGFAKEDIIFWQRLQTKAAFNPHRTLMVDDNMPVLYAAETAGIDHLLAISEPDTQKPPQDTKHFISVANLGEALPN